MEKVKPNILVSACLLGVNCNYKGCHSFDFTKDTVLWEQLLKNYNVIPVCPEQLGGLCTPRIPSELTGSASDVFGGRALVISKQNVNVTENFVKGARETLRLAKLYNVQFAILKSKSPSCGVNSVYDGTFKGILIPGKGMTAYLLDKEHFNTYSEDKIEEILKCTLSDFADK